MKGKVLNEVKMILFTAVLGAIAGALVWGFLRLLTICTKALWTDLPSKLDFNWYPLILCTAGGLIIGIMHHFFGDYPEELPVVMGKIKKTGGYPYKNMLILLIMAFLPLLFAGSVGPEAGLTGIIAGLCSWVGDNIKYAQKEKNRYSEIGEAITLGVIFHAPLFGIVAVDEPGTGEEREKGTIPKPLKLVLYGIAIGAAFGVIALLRHFFGAAAEGLPRLEFTAPAWQDYVLMLVYIPVGLLLFLFFEGCEWIAKKLASIIPAIPRGILCGVLIGFAGMYLPILLFSGEEQMGELSVGFGAYAPLFLIGIALLKCLLTTCSIQFGFRGGHFFPLIFACVCGGFGVCMLIFGDSASSHVVFAAAVVTAATLGAQMKKPVAVMMLLMLMFPVRMLLPILLAAALGGIVGGRISQEEVADTAENVS